MPILNEKRLAIKKSAELQFGKIIIKKLQIPWELCDIQLQTEYHIGESYLSVYCIHIYFLFILVRERSSIPSFESFNLRFVFYILTFLKAVRISQSVTFANNN